MIDINISILKHKQNSINNDAITFSWVWNEANKTLLTMNGSGGTRRETPSIPSPALSSTQSIVQRSATPLA